MAKRKSNWPRMKTCDTCHFDFHTSDLDATTCPSCKQESKSTDYGLRFFNGVAEPTQAFWKAWRANKDAVKRQGYIVRKKGSGFYKVHRAEKSDKQRVREAINNRYSRKNGFGM